MQGPDLGDVTAEDVGCVLKTGSKSTARMDKSKPAELTWIFCRWLAVIFNLVLCARSAYISKEEEPNIKDLLKYRVITCSRGSTGRG